MNKLKDAFIDGIDYINNEEYQYSKCTGKSKDKGRYIEIIVPDKNYRSIWIDLNSFSGVILRKNNKKSKYVKGSIEWTKITDSSSYQEESIYHYHEMIKEVLGLTKEHEQWNKFRIKYPNSTMKKLNSDQWIEIHRSLISDKISNMVTQIKS